MDLPTAAAGSFDFSLSAILCSVIFSVIGIWLFRYAKRETNFSVLFVAVAMMFYSYFTKGPLADWGVGLGLCGLAYYFR